MASSAAMSQGEAEVAEGEENPAKAEETPEVAAPAEPQKAIMAVALLTSITIILANLITDITYAFVDPRIRHS